MNSRQILLTCAGTFGKGFGEVVGFGTVPGIADELAFLALAHYRWMEVPPAAPSRSGAGSWVVWTAGIWLHKGC